MKKQFFSFLLLMLVSPLVMFAQQQDTTKLDNNAAIFYNKSVGLVKEGNLKDALAYVDSAIAIAKDYRLSFLKAQIYKKLEDNNNAIAQLQECIALNKSYDPAYLQLSAIYSTQKEYDKVIALNKELIANTQDAQKKNDAEMMIAEAENTIAVDFLNSGVDLIKASKFDEALQAFDKSLALKKVAKAYFYKGYTYKQMQKPEEAKKEFGTAIQLDSAYVMAYISIAEIYREAKDSKSAIPYYIKAVSLAPDEAKKAAFKEALRTAYVSVGLTAFTEKKWDASIESLNKSLEIAKNDKALLNLGRAYSEKKQWDLALQSFDASLDSTLAKKSVTPGSVAYYKAKMYQSKGDSKKALEQFKLALTDDNFKKFAQSEIDAMNAPKDAKKPK
jgi:tetratricopeptide (TPR) repeat protein